MRGGGEAREQEGCHVKPREEEGAQCTEGLAVSVHPPQSRAREGSLEGIPEVPECLALRSFNFWVFKAVVSGVTRSRDPCHTVESLCWLVWG